MSIEVNPVAVTARITDPVIRQALEGMLCAYLSKAVVHLVRFSGFAKLIANHRPGANNMPLIDPYDRFYENISWLLGMDMVDIAKWIEVSDSAQELRFHIPPGYHPVVMRVSLDGSGMEDGLWGEELDLVLQDEVASDS